MTPAEWIARDLHPRLRRAAAITAQWSPDLGSRAPGNTPRIRAGVAVVDRRRVRRHRTVHLHRNRRWDLACPIGHDPLPALRRATLDQLLRSVGFTTTEWLMPEHSGYYQPMVIATP